MELDFQISAGNTSRVLKPFLLVAVLIIGIVLIIPNGWNLRVQRLTTFEILMMGALAVCVFPVNKPLSIMAGYVALTLPFHQAIEPEIMLALAAYLVLYLMVASFNWDREWLWNTICGVAIISVAHQVGQSFGLWIGQVPLSPKSYVGLLSNTNEVSAFLAVCLPSFFRKGWKWLIPIPLIGMYLGVSIGGTVAAYLAGIVYLGLNFKRMGFRRVCLWFMAMTILLSVFIVHKDPALRGSLIGMKEIKIGSMSIGEIRSDIVTNNKNGRYQYWIDMLPVVNMKPAGWGLGQFKFIMPLIQTPGMFTPQVRMLLYQNIGDKRGFEEALRKASNGDINYLLKPRWNEIWLEAHNEYMEIWLALGITGLLLFVCCIGDTLWKAKDSIQRYGFLISCISAIWFFSWQIVPIAIVTIIYLGVLHHEKNT